MNTATLIKTIVQARRDLAALATLQDPHLTFEGLRARQRNEWEGIRGRLAALMPAEPAVPDRQPVLDALAPKGADDLALQAHQWSKVRALLDAGHDLPSIIRDADRTRLAAILDNLETMPEVLQDSSPASVVEFVQGAVWERLVEVDDAAGRVATLEAATLPALAWRSILEGMTETGEIPFDGLVLLHQAEPEVYDLLVDGDALAAPAPASGSIPLLVEALDRVPATV